MKHLYVALLFCMCDVSFAEVGGQVVDIESGMGIANAYVYVARVGDEVRSLFPDGGGEEQCIGAKVVRTGVGGRFRSENVVASDNQIYLRQRYYIMVYHPEFYYKRKLSSGDYVYHSVSSEYLSDGDDVTVYLYNNTQKDNNDRIGYIGWIVANMCPIYNESTIELIDALYSEAAKYGMKGENRMRYMDMCQLTAISLKSHGIDYSFLYQYGCEEHIKRSRVLRSMEQDR